VNQSRIAIEPGHCSLIDAFGAYVAPSDAPARAQLALIDALLISLQSVRGPRGTVGMEPLGELGLQCEALAGRKQAVAASLRQPSLTPQQRALLEEE
jgi:hypothetical protein